MPYGYRQVHGSEGLGSISGVVSSLPVGYALGEEREDNGISYRLVYNAGGEEIGPGYGCGSRGGAGAYSVTVTTTLSDQPLTLAGVVKHATLTTDTYGWVAKKGYVGKLVVSNVSIATGAVVQIGAAGVFAAATITAVVGHNVGDDDGTATTDTLSGDFYVNFD